MYSDNAPPSFTGSVHDNQQILATGDVYTSQTPSQGDLTHIQQNSNNHFQGVTGYRGFPGQNPLAVDNNNKPPSFKDIGPGQQNSYNQDPNRSRELGGNSYGSGQPVSLGDMVKVNVSDTGGDHYYYYKDDKAPTRSDVDRRAGASDTGPSPDIVIDGADPQDFVGISLVGKNFRKFYPNAYYREDQDDES